MRTAEHTPNAEPKHAPSADPKQPAPILKPLAATELFPEKPKDITQVAQITVPRP